MKITKLQKARGVACLMFQTIIAEFSGCDAHPQLISEKMQEYDRLVADKELDEMAQGFNEEF